MILKNYKEIQRVFQLYPHESYTITTKTDKAVDIKDIDGNNVGSLTLPYSLSNNRATGLSECRLHTPIIFDCFSFLSDVSIKPCDTNRSSSTGAGEALYGCSMVVLGSGTEEVDFTDYKLSSILATTDFSINTISTYCEGYDVDNNLIISVIVNGTASKGITISEVGITKSVLKSSTIYIDGGAKFKCSYSKVQPTEAYSSNFRNVLVVRELLDEPIVLSAGDTFNVTIKVKM